MRYFIYLTLLASTSLTAGSIHKWTDADGNVIGGSNLLVASIEYERHLKGNFYGAVFIDAGNAFDDTDFTAEVGAGFGIKWRSPLGPIRLYLGYPVSDSDESVRVHLRLGADL